VAARALGKQNSNLNVLDGGFHACAGAQERGGVRWARLLARGPGRGRAVRGAAATRGVRGPGPGARGGGAGAGALDARGAVAGQSDGLSFSTDVAPPGGKNHPV